MLDYKGDRKQETILIVPGQGKEFYIRKENVLLTQFALTELTPSKREYAQGVNVTTGRPGNVDVLRLAFLMFNSGY